LAGFYKCRHNPNNDLEKSFLSAENDVVRCRVGHVLERSSETQFQKLFGKAREPENGWRMNDESSAMAQITYADGYTGTMMLFAAHLTT
jgi:hypothetical protein